MMRTFAFILAALAISACSPQERSADILEIDQSRGSVIIFKSNAEDKVLALYTDEGSYRYYQYVSEVGGPSDLGGYLKPCGESASTCVEFQDVYFMVPPVGVNEWAFGGYNFHVTDNSSGREGRVVVVSRNGEEPYSYRYSPHCGVEWINFSTGEEKGERVYYPVGRSLFSESVCASGPTA